MKKFKYKWFYYIDHKGLLYLEEVEPKNYTTCLKQKKALDFFFEHLQPNDLGIHEDYTFISPWWTEMNFVKWYKHPIVFSNLAKLGPEKYQLSYAGDLTQEFHPSKLLMDDSGHFLHPLENHKHIKYGSFDTSLSVSLGEKVSEEDGQTFIEWDNDKYRLNIL